MNIDTQVSPGESAPPPRWWGEFDAPSGSTRHWRIGPLRLYAWRGVAEWHVAFAQGDDPLDPSCAVSLLDRPPEEDGEMTEHRYALAHYDARLWIGARTADRAVVVQPARPLFVPAGQQAMLYVSSAAWLTLSACDADGERVPLLEIPTRRPSDTWFGESTRYGELCYATRTLARTSSELLMDLPYRVFTAVVIDNSGVDTLPVAQLRVPAPNLSVYADARGRLWTDTVVFDREEGESQATMRVGDRPAEAADAVSVSEPRDRLHASAVVRAFSRIFG